MKLRGDIVIDASAVVELTCCSQMGRDIDKALSGQDASLHSPTFLDIEVLNALRNLRRGGGIDEEGQNKAVKTLNSLRRKRHDFSDLAGRILSLQHDLTAYDAAYVALALKLNASLLTLDQGQLQVAQRHGIEVFGPSCWQ